jgi:hypothetical protein
MSTIYHTPIDYNAIADDDTFNDPLGQIDLALDDANTFITAHGAELSAARGGYASLDARLDQLVAVGGNIATQANGAASAGQKNVTVDSTVGFVATAYVAYTLPGGTIEYNTIASITPTTLLTLGTNIGTGGIADNAYISMISPSEYQAANAIYHGSTDLTLPQAMKYAAGGVFNIMAYGASPSASAAVNTAAIQAAIVDMNIEDAGATGDYAGTLVIPPGVFEIEDTLTFTSLRGFKLTGTGHASRLVWTPTEPTLNVIEITDCRNSRISDLYISTSGTCNAAIKVYGTAGDGVPTHNLFENVMMDLGGAQYGFQIGGAAPAVDANNDFMEFHNCEIYNYLDSGVKFVSSSQAYNYLFLNCAFLGDGTSSKYAIDCGSGTAVGGFSVIGGGSANHTIAAFRIANIGSQPVLIQDHNEEGNNRFLVASSLSQVEVKHCRLSASGVNADKILIIGGGTNASLIIDNCIIGDGTVGGTVALIVARMAYGSDANAQKWGRFVFTNNIVYSTLDGTAWNDWPFDNSGSGYILPTEMSGNLVITDAGTLVAKKLDFNNGATGAGLEVPYPFINKVGGARVIRTTNAGYPFTTFDSVPPYHIFTVICDHTNTFKDKSQAGGDNLWLAGHADWTATVGSSITFFHDFDNDRFIEIARSQY